MQEKKFMKGCEAVAEAAIRAGCRRRGKKHGAHQFGFCFVKADRFFGGQSRAEQKEKRPFPELVCGKGHSYIRP